MPGVSIPIDFNWLSALLHFPMKSSRGFTFCTQWGLWGRTRTKVRSSGELMVCLCPGLQLIKATVCHSRGWHIGLVRLSDLLKSAGALIPHTWFRLILLVWILPLWGVCSEQLHSWKLGNTSHFCLVLQVCCGSVINGSLCLGSGGYGIELRLTGTAFLLFGADMKHGDISPIVKRTARWAKISVGLLM